MNLFDKNIKDLDKNNKNIIDKIKNAEKPDWLIVDGDNFQIKKADKIFNAYNERYKELVDSVKKNDLLKENITIFIGIGLGKFLHKSLTTKEKEHKIVVVDPEYYFIKLFFEKYDVAKYIKNHTLIIIEAKNETIQYTLSLVEANLVIQNWFTLSEYYINYLPEIYSDLLTYTRDMVNQIQCNVGTVMGAGTIIAENDIKNLPYVIRHRGVAEIKDLYKNKPAVIVSTGPSLNKNIHILKENKDKVIIIAVAQALRALLAYNIKPDFICTVDYGKTNMDHFNGLFNITDIPLVALNRTYAPILKKWKGPKFIAISDNYCHKGTVSEFISKKGNLIQAGSVSHFCLGLAVHLGCSNIGIVGQDLAYEGNRSHIELADASGEINIKKDGNISWKVDDPNSHLNDTENNMGNMQKVEGYFNDGINNLFLPTNHGLASFIIAFENIIKTLENINIYNCTEGGANIKGAEIISLRNFIKNNGIDNKAIETKKLNKYLSLIENADDEINSVIPVLKKEIKMLDDIKTNSIKAIKAANKMLEKNVMSDKKKLDKYAEENKKYSDKAESLTKQIQLMGMHIYKTSREIKTRKYNVHVKNLFKEKNKRKTRIERNIVILEAAKEASITLKKIYNESMELLKQYIDTKDESLLLNKDKELIDFDIEKNTKYIDTGNFAFPLLQFKQSDTLKNDYIDKFTQCIKLREEKIKKAIESYDKREKLIEYVKLIKETKKETNLKNINFENMIDLFKKAIKILPDEFSARWGLATTYHHTENFNSSLIMYNSLIADFPDNLRLQFEKAFVVLNIDEKEGMKLLENVLIKTDKFDHIYNKLGNLYLKNNIKEKAIKCYKKYLDKFPDNKEVKNKLMSCQLSSSDC